MFNKRIKLVSLLASIPLAISMVLGLLMTSTVVNASSAGYSPNQITLSQGQLVSGSNASLSSQDSSFLVINSTKQGSYYITDWYAEFTLPSRQVASLNIGYSGKYSTFRGQYLYLYNFNTATWQNVNYSNIGPAMVNVNLPSIANPASYVSADGKVRLKVYCLSTSSFAAYTDYLKLGVTFADSTPTPTPAPATTPTPATAPSPVPAPTSTPVSGTYYSNGTAISGGQLVSGSASTLSTKDASYLTINSINSSGYTCLDWTAQFTLPSRQVSNLSLSYSGKYSAFRGQYIYLYNYSTSAWQNVNYTNIGMTVADINLPSIPNPTSFVSPTGQVQVRLYSLSSSGYTAYIDCLKLGIAY